MTPFSFGNTGLTDQTATNGGANTSFLYQGSDFATSDASITQTADGAESANSATHYQNDLTFGGKHLTTVVQNAQTAGTNQAFTDQQGVFGVATITQTATNEGSNVAEVLQLDQYTGNTVQATITQTADGAGGGNDASVIQGDLYGGQDGATFAFATVIQTSTNSGVNQATTYQEGDLPGINEVVVEQNADSYDGFNDMYIVQDDFTDFAYAETLQNATDAGFNVSEVYQGGDFEETYIDQTADGMGSANTIYVQQAGNGIAIGFAPIADITQDAMASGKKRQQVFSIG